MVIDFSSLKKINVDLDHHNSFGCGQANQFGLRMKFATDGKRVCSQIYVPEYLCSWQNLIHGGIVGTILDEIMFWSAMYFTKKIVLTKKTTIELKCPPSSKYMPVQAFGYIKGRQGESSVIMAGELYNNRGDQYATANADFATIDPAIADRLNILTLADVDMVRGFIKSF